MSRPIPIQVYVSPELATRVRAVAERQHMTVSAWLRAQLARACEEDDHASQHDTSITRILRMGVFSRVGIDALLAGHPDPKLRDKVYAIYARKCEAIGLPSTAGEGGRDEA